MYRPTLKLFQIASPLLLALAVVGYLVGHRHSAPTPASVAYGKSVVLEYPTGWQQVAAAGAPNIPGLHITDALVLAPGGQASSAGLISGQIPATSQLPSAFLSELHRLPRTEVVDLTREQAYRYSQLTVPGYAPALVLYVVPTPGTSHAVLACYAPSPTSIYMQRCQRIAASLTSSGERPGDLTPEASYAGTLDRLIKTLSRTRATLRSAMRARTAAGTQSQLASDLAHSYAVAAASLSTLEPPPPVGPEQAALATALLSTQHDYEALSRAALAGARSAYVDTQARIGGAEASVDDALKGFALVGYGGA